MFLSPSLSSPLSFIHLLPSLPSTAPFPIFSFNFPLSLIFLPSVLPSSSSTFPSFLPFYFPLSLLSFLSISPLPSFPFCFSVYLLFLFFNLIFPRLSSFVSLPCSSIFLPFHLFPSHLSSIFFFLSLYIFCDTRVWRAVADWRCSVCGHDECNE